MLRDVRERRAQFNNPSKVSASGLRTRLKLLYYHLFALLYGFAGSFASVVMVNSSWTRNHIASLWRSNARAVETVFPPCNVVDMSRAELGGRSNRIVAVAQFRPEKNHALMLEALALYLQRAGAQQDVELLLIGGCRDAGDEARLAAVEEKARALGIDVRAVQLTVVVTATETRCCAQERPVFGTCGRAFDLVDPPSYGTDPGDGLQLMSV